MIAGASLAATKPASALTVQEAILRATPAVVLVTSEVGAEVTMNCGTGPVTIQTAPFIETGTGWFIDGRGYLVTNAHVVEPAYRQPPWVAHELKKKAIEQACVDPELKARGLMPGQRPDLEERIRREASQRALETAKLTSSPQITVLFGGKKIPAEVKKFSPPASLDATGQPTKDFGRDLALLQVKDGVYPALSLTGRAVNVGDSVHILGFPGVVMSHELLNRSVQASVTSGTASAFQKDAIGQDMIQTDASAAHGNSGGPAITNDGTVIGVLTAVTLAGSSGSIVQGFNFLIPAKDVSTFLAGTPAIPGQSRFNDVWYAGLAAYFEGGYAAAVARMDQGQGEAPAAAAVPVGLGDARRHALERRRVRRHVGPSLVEGPVPHPAGAGDRAHRERPESGDGRRPHPGGIRHQSVQVARRRPSRARRRRRRTDSAPGGSDPDDRNVLHEPRRGDQRKGLVSPPQARLSQRSHPEGGSGRLDECPPSGRDEVAHAVDR
ncbi:MAG: hypothetical protein DMD81_05170, partial [Candidatus Rokuibacteriota bacterium]